MGPTIYQIAECTDRAQLVKWQIQTADSVIHVREFQAIKSRIDTLDRDDEVAHRHIANKALERIELNLSGIHDHARRPEHKTWAFRLAVIGVLIGIAALVVAIVALCRDFYNWQQPPNHADASRAIEPTKRNSDVTPQPLAPILANPASASASPETLLSSKVEGKGEAKTPVESPPEAKKEGVSFPSLDDANPSPKAEPSHWREHH